MRYKRQSDGELWVLIGTARDPAAPDDSSKQHHILRSSDGIDFYFPVETFQSDFKPDSTLDHSADDAIRETLANIRHNSTVRFAMLPFFLTGSVVLANAHKQYPWSTDALVPMFGVGLGLIAALLEIAISRNLICWWNEIEKQGRGTLWSMLTANRAPGMLWTIRYALFIPYLATIAYWVHVKTCSLLAAAILPALLVLVSLVVWKHAASGK